MKKINVILGGLMSACVLASCSDFLNEELTTQRNMDYYNTEEGIESLATTVYYQTLAVCNGEWIYCFNNYGTDEFQIGGDGSSGCFNNYDSGLGSVVIRPNGNCPQADDLWNVMYKGIGYANLLIDKVEHMETTKADTKVHLGEAYFCRAFNYFRLASQYGGVPLKLQPSTSVEREFTRASAQEVLDQVVSDLKQAYSLLPETGATGRITKDAAAHYLAKTYLLRCSEINDSWNSSIKQTELQEAVRLGKEVISHHPLASNFVELWDFKEPDGANEQLDEIILAGQFTNNKAYARSNYLNTYFVSRYDDLSFMKRDLTGCRPYSRLHTSYFVYRIYDMVNDSRFWKSFRTKSRMNNASGDYHTNGDIGIMYVINQPGDTRYAQRELTDEVVDNETGKTIAHCYVAYPAGRTEDGALYEDVRFPSLSKYIDASRETVNDVKGNRDLIYARSAETYLIVAEAEVRLGNYQEALSYINAVRQRAAYQEGEDRAAYVDGGQAWASSELNQDPDLNSYMPENSYYESNGIGQTTVATDLTVTDIHALPEGDEYVIRKLGLSSDYDRMLAFVLNERSRELCGELHRWADLSRTKTLVQRAKAFNTGAAPNIDDHHCLRPIPQTYLDAIQKDGHNLTVEEKQAQQNPGY